MTSRQLLDTLEFYKASFWWKPGRYVVQCFEPQLVPWTRRNVPLVKAQRSRP